MSERRWGEDTPTVASLTGVLRGAGITALALAGPEDSGAPHEFDGRTIELLVPRRKRRAALRVMEETPWRYRLGAAGVWRLLPGVNYWWARLNVFIYWGLPAMPFPALAMRRLERALWAGARPHPDGYLEPDASALLVHLAFQASRPGRRQHQRHFEHFLVCRPKVADWDRVWRLAASSGLKPALEQALAAADAGREHTTDWPVFGGVRSSGWRAALILQRRARPEHVRALLAGRPQLGNARVRGRVAGVEVQSGPRVFVHTPDAELFVETALERISGVANPTVVEVGTGSGAIGLAIADAHAGATVHASDLSHDAMRWSKRNARRLHLRRRVRLYTGSLLEPFPRDDLAGRVDVLLANLPFYPSEDYAAIGAVPRDTIEGEGEDGLGLVRTLAREARMLLKPGGTLVLQMFDWQWERFGVELAALGYDAESPKLSGPFAIGAGRLR